MKGRISLKDFIHGVKRELLETSASTEGNAAFEMTTVELETEFVLEASAKVEGGFAFFVKAEGGTSASQTHKVKITLRPLKSGAAIGFGAGQATTESFEFKAPTVSAIGAPMFVSSPDSYPQNGFPYVHFDPSRQISGTIGSGEPTSSLFSHIAQKAKKPEGDA